MHAAMSCSEQQLVRSYTWDSDDCRIVSSSCSSSWSCRLSDQAHMYTVILLDLINDTSSILPSMAPSSQDSSVACPVCCIPARLFIHSCICLKRVMGPTMTICIHSLAPVVLLGILPFEVPQLLLAVSRLIACLKVLGCYSMLLGIDGICNGGPVLLQHGQ